MSEILDMSFLYWKRKSREALNSCNLPSNALFMWTLVSERSSIGARLWRGGEKCHPYEISGDGLALFLFGVFSCGEWTCTINVGWPSSTTRYKNCIPSILSFLLSFSYFFCILIFTLLLISIWQFLIEYCCCHFCGWDRHCVLLP